MDLKQLWREAKAYFGDGFLEGSSPLRFNTHFCSLSPQAKTNKVFYGVELNDETMPLFSTMGPTSVPSCTCGRIRELCQHIEAFVQTAPSSNINDYSLHSGKNDSSVDEVCLYVMRDAMQWWSHWHGSLDGHVWKILYIAFSTIPDVVMIPPQHLVDGTFRFLGHTISDVLDGLRSENVHPDDITYLENCLRREYVLQYVEKADAELRKMLLSNSTLMTQFRTVTANTHGGAIGLLAARNVKTLGVADVAVEISAVCDALSMDIAKECLGVLRGEATEAVAGDREQLMSELRWLYVRCVEALDASPNGHLLRRYATSGLHFVPTMDRYLERIGGNRFPISEVLYRRLESFTCTSHEVE